MLNGESRYAFSVHPIYKNPYELQPEKRGGGAIAIDTGADAGEGPGRNGRLRSLVINGTILKTATETTAYDGCMYGSHRLCLSRSHFASV